VKTRKSYAFSSLNTKAIPVPKTQQRYFLAKMRITATLMGTGCFSS